MPKIVTFRSTLIAIACAISLSAHAMADTARKIDVPAGELITALQQLAKQSGAELIYFADQLKGIHTNGVQGEYTAEKAAAKLLEGTRFHVAIHDSGALLISAAPGGSAEASSGVQTRDPSFWSRLRLAQTDTSSTSQADSQNPSPSKGEGQGEDGKPAQRQKAIELEEVVVTGTHLRKVEPLSPLITITHDDLVKQGYSRLDQAIEQLPQHFKAGASTETNPNTAIGDGASFNYSRGSGINLRGLGARATLVLLNGQRLAPSNFGDSVDISLIPVSLIDRVEIVTGGASAIYGADAVAGVVNIITRKNYSGTEFGGRATGIADGKAPNFGGYGLVGSDWSGGNLVLNVDYQKDSPLYTRSRSVTSDLGDPTSLLLDQRIASYYAAIHQNLAAGLDFSSNLRFARRDFDDIYTQSPLSGPPFRTTTDGSSKQTSADVQFDYALPGEWHTLLAGHYTREEGFTSGEQRDPDGLIASTSFDELVNRDTGADLRVDGPIFSMPAGRVRAALGATYRQENIENDHFGSPLAENSRNARSVYAEVLLPLANRESGIPLVEQLTFDAAGRYDDYSDFGSTFNPKFGLRWEMPAGLAFHAGYGRSFRTPTLFQTIPGVAAAAFVFDLPDPKSPSGVTRTLLYGHVDPNLQAERSRSIEVGFTFAPQSVQDFSIELSYFDIKFRNKIEQISRLGFFTDVLEREDELGTLVTRNPSLADVNAIFDEPGQFIYSDVGDYDASEIAAAVNLIGYVNAAIVHPRGLDLMSRYGITTAAGRWSLDAAATYYVDYENQISPTSTSFSAIDRAYLPTRFRFKLGIGWNQSSWAAFARANFVSAYDTRNSNDPACPGPRGCAVSAWTTVDAGFSYSTAPTDSFSFLAGMRFSLDVSNLFDREPPFVLSAGHFNYDATNANALQRALAVTITKSF